MFFIKKLKIFINEINLIEKFYYYLIISGLIYFIFLLFIKQDNDFYAFLYFGQRLIKHNELIWTKEFDDKLPIVQYIFTIPAYFNSIKIWGILILILLITASVLLFFTIKNNIFKDLEENYLNFDFNKNKFIKSKNEIKFEASILASAVFFYINIYTPSSIFHINSLSSSLFTISLCIILFAIRKKNEINFFLKVFSILIMSIAISLRPFFFLASAIIFFWFSVIEKAKPNIKSIIFNNIIYNITLVFFVIIINFFPFIINKKTNIAISGFLWLSQKYSKQTFIGLFSHQAETLFIILNKTIFIFCILYFAFMIAYFFNYKKKNIKANFNILFLSILAPLSIEIFFLFKNFWFHHFVFFSLFISLSIAFFFKELLSNQILVNLNNNKILYKLIMVIFIIGLFFNDLVFALSNLKKSTEIDNKILEIRISKFLEKEKNKDININNVSFLYPTNMYIHWALNESRYGFPHHANTIQIFNGWFKKLKYKNPIDMPENAYQYCNKIQNQGPALIITDNFLNSGSDLIEECLKINASNYKIYKMININNNQNLFIYKKNKK
jgi:hypothetical protein